MTPKDFPILLTKRKLIDPIDRSINKLKEIQTHIDKDLHILLLHGLFVMAVSRLEVAITDSLKYLLKNFPQKIDKEEFKFPKEDFFENYFTLIPSAVERFVLRLSRKSFQEYFGDYVEKMSIDITPADQDLVLQIQEINATRNLLLHNDLVINDEYIQASGEKCRSKEKGARLKLDLQYITEAIKLMLVLNEAIQKKLLTKYDEYTNIAANKRLWKFIFDSPVMPYEDFWEVNEKTDSIYRRKKGEYEDVISNSERLLLELWRSHFNEGDLKGFDMRHFDKINQWKVLFLISIASDFSFS